MSMEDLLRKEVAVHLECNVHRYCIILMYKSETFLFIWYF